MAGFNLGMASGFWRLLREVSPGGIARGAEQPFCVLISGQPGVGRRTLRGALSGGRWPSEAILPYLRIVEGVPTETYGASLCLHVMDATRGLFRAEWEATARLEQWGVPVVYVFSKVDLVPDRAAFVEAAKRMLGSFAEFVCFVDAVDAEGVHRKLVPTLLRAAPQLRLALGRRLPSVRDEVASQVIAETTRANAEFALLSSLPANLPLLGIGSLGADTVVLTKNQLMMLFKLAAIYGRPLDQRARLLAEIAPVVGAAFLWRTAARTAVGLLPSVVSAAPKTLIASVGTYVVGRAAQHYYRSGLKPSRSDLGEYAREARALLRGALPRIELPSGVGIRGFLLGRRDEPEE